MKKFEQARHAKQNAQSLVPVSTIIQGRVRQNYGYKTKAKQSSQFSGAIRRVKFVCSFRTTMFRLLLMLLVAQQHHVFTIASSSETRTLFGHSSDNDRSVKTFTVSADADVSLSNHQRNKRDVLQPQPIITNVTVLPKVSLYFCLTC